MVLRISVSLVI